MSEFAVELRRTIAAPREEVFRALLDPELVGRWMCPPACVVTGVEIDERVGGRHRVDLVTAGGEPHAFDAVIREIVANERVVLDFAFVGPEPGWREETVLTLSLRDAGDGQTELRLHQERIAHVGGLNERSVKAGWGHALDTFVALYDKETT